MASSNIFEQRYKTLYEKSPVLLRTITVDGILTECNETYQRALGYTREEAIGMSFYDHTAERSIDDLKHNLEEWKKNHDISHQEIWMKRKDGSTFPSMLSGASICDADGNLIGRTVALTDMTEIFEARTKLQNAEAYLRGEYEELQKIEMIKEEFLAMITHELKTPLVPVLGYIDLFLAEQFGKLTDKQKEKLQVIKSRTSHLLKIISDLLDLQKLEIGQFRLDKKHHNLVEIINETVKTMKPVLESAGIFTSCYLEQDVFCICDKTRIEQVISNIINNAMDFCPKHDGQIFIKLYHKDETNAKIIIKDNGVGVPKDKLEKIFVKFYQIDKSTTREHGGTGLGLSVCKGIIESHGGKIWVESEGKGKGTEIHILLPMNEQILST
jgi:PAS domain S-box-containing protein